MTRPDRKTTSFMTRAILLFSLISIVPVSPAAQYDLGRTYKYQYTTSVVLNEPDSTRGKNVTYQVKAEVAATTVWQDPVNEGHSLLLLQVTDPALYVVPKGSMDGELTKHTSSLESYKDTNVVLHLVDGNVVASIYADDREPSDFLGFKAGIASLFQFQLQDKEHVEVDSSGQCTAIYESAGEVVHKFKKNCVTTLPNNHANDRIRTNKVFGVGIVSEVRSTYTLNREQIISSVETLEVQRLTLNAFDRVGAFVQAKQNLNFVGDEDGQKLLVKGDSMNSAIVSLSTVLSKEITPRPFHSSISILKKTENCATLPEYVTKKSKSLKTENLAKFSAASTFLDLVQRFRRCEKEVLAKILKSSKNKNILPQLLDIAAATQTSAAVEAVISVLKFDSDSIDLPERFLLALATVPYPDENTIRAITDLLKSGTKNAKLSETLLLTIGSLTKTYYGLHGHDKIVEDAISLLLSKLSECKLESCKLSHLRALRNAAIPSTASVLISNVQSGGKLAVEALRALQTLPRSVMTEKTKIVLVQVYHQLLKKQDSTARILAAEMLLSNFATLDVVQSLFAAMDNSSIEVNTYVLQMMSENSAKSEAFRDLVQSVLRNPRIGNYNILAQNGDSTALTHLLAGNRIANATYGLYMEMLGGGLMKQSDFAVSLNYDDSSMNLFTFGLSAGGLGSMVGDSKSAEVDDEEMTAGMQLNVLEVSLRPYTLFTGQGELMGHVWSGTGSETTPIFTGNFLLHDHRQSFALQNGFALQLSVSGALSLDMSGSIQSSLWNRNAHSVIEDKVAVIVQSETRVDSSFINSHVWVNTGAEASLEFVTDIQFAQAPFKMCALMSQPAFPIRRVVSKVENIPGSKHRRRRTRRLTDTIPGRSFEMSPKNSRLCSAMLN